MTQKLNNLEADVMINLLPESYKKMIDRKILQTKIIDVDFFEEKDGKTKKMTHGVKKVKGTWIKKLCETNFAEFEELIQDKISKQETKIEVLQ